MARDDLTAWILVACLLLAGCSTAPTNNQTPGPDDGTDTNDTDTPPANGPWPTNDEVPAADESTLNELVRAQIHTNGTEPRYRTPGTAGHAATIPILESMLEQRGATVTTQTFSAELPKLGEVNLTNVYGVREGSSEKEIWLAAHWDSRAWADAHREACTGPPVLGANDGAAGVAVVVHALDLLEPTNATIRVALFDGEDQGCRASNVDSGYGDSAWAVGSTHAAQQLSRSELDDLQALVLVDMPGDANLTIRREGNSHRQAPELTDIAFGVAERLDASSFENETGPGILDDHREFLDRGVPAVDLVHLDRDDRRGPFPWTHHTEEDTLEHISDSSMAEVTRVVVGTVMALDRGLGPGTR